MTVRGLDLYLTDFVHDELPSCGACGTQFVVYEPDDFGDTPYTVCPECDAEPCVECGAVLDWDEEHSDWECWECVRRDRMGA